MSTVLLVDDDLDALWALQLALEDRDHHVVLAENGRQAMEKLTREPIQLVVTDWEMPDMDGLELCRSIRCRPSMVDLPVVLMSAAAEPTEVNRNWSAFLRKPFSPDMLLERIEMFLARRLVLSGRGSLPGYPPPATRWPALDARCWP